MTGILIFLLLIVLLAGFVFFASFYLELNTVQGLYRIRFHRIARANMKTVDGYPVLELNVLGWKKNMDLTAPRKIKAKKSRLPVKRKSRIRRMRLSKLKAVLLSFRIKKCRIQVDTGDMQLNGMLYPVFFLLGFYSGKDIGINFTNHNELVLEVENSLARMSWAYISS